MNRVGTAEGKEAGQTGRRRTIAMAGWFVAAVWLGLVVLLGGSLFSFRHTLPVFMALFRRLAPQVPLQAIMRWHDFARWSAHFVEYGIFALILFAKPLRGRPMTAMLFCLAVALLDEGRQTLDPTRSGNFWDVSLDFGGVVTVIVLALPSWGIAEAKISVHE